MNEHSRNHCNGCRPDVAGLIPWRRPSFLPVGRYPAEYGPLPLIATTPSPILELDELHQVYSHRSCILRLECRGEAVMALWWTFTSR